MKKRLRYAISALIVFGLLFISGADTLVLRPTLDELIVKSWIGIDQQSPYGVYKLIIGKDGTGQLLIHEDVLQSWQIEHWQLKGSQVYFSVAPNQKFTENLGVHAVIPVEGQPLTLRTRWRGQDDLPERTVLLFPEQRITNALAQIESSTTNSPRLQSAAEAEIPKEFRFDDMSYRTAGLYERGGAFFHAEYFPSGQASTNAAKSVEFFRQQLSTDTLDQLVELHLKSLEDWKPKVTFTILEKSERHLVLKDIRFDGTLSGRPFFILYLYELEGRTLLTSQFIFRPRRPFDSAEAFSNEFTAKETKWLKDLRQVSRTIQKAILEQANKGAAANRR